MFTYMMILSVTVFLLSNINHIHLKSMSVVTLGYCLCVEYKTIFTFEDYLISNLILMIVTLYYMILGKDKYQSYGILSIPLVIKVYEFSLANLWLDLYIIPHYLIYKSDYILLSSVLLLLILESTDYNWKEFYIKDFKSMVQLIVYIFCTVNIMII